jgi:hypothetical protein
MEEIYKFPCNSEPCVRFPVLQARAMLLDRGGGCSIHLLTVDEVGITCTSEKEICANLAG